MKSRYVGEVERNNEKQTGRKIKELQIDNIERYKNQFLRFGQNTGIGTQFTDRIHGLAKEINRFLLEKVQYLLSNAQLDKSFWAEEAFHKWIVIDCDGW